MLAWTKMCVSVSYQSRQSLSRKLPVPIRTPSYSSSLGPVAVGLQRLPAAAGQPHAAVVAVARLHHHLIVVAAQRDQPPGVEQGDEAVEDAARIGAAIDVVAQGDEPVVRLQRRQRPGGRPGRCEQP